MGIVYLYFLGFIIGFGVAGSFAALLIIPRTFSAALKDSFHDE